MSLLLFETHPSVFIQIRYIGIHLGTSFALESCILHELRCLRRRRESIVPRLYVFSEILPSRVDSRTVPASNSRMSSVGRGHVSPAMLGRRVRFVTEIAFVRPTVGRVIVGYNFFTNYITSTNVYSRVQGQMSLGAEGFVAHRANVNLVLLAVTLKHFVRLGIIHVCRFVRRGVCNL